MGHGLENPDRGSGLALVIWAGWVGITGWNLESDVQMDVHGYAAMAIGVVGSLVVGIAIDGAGVLLQPQGLRRCGRPYIRNAATTTVVGRSDPDLD